MDKIDIAKQAFWGSNESLMDHILDKNGYEMDGQYYPANGITLAETIKAVESMSDEELQSYDIRSSAARILGSIKSERKAETSRENGKHGGRPRKCK